MLKIRLQRVGRKHEPVFRIVVTESTRGPKSGNFIEVLGNHDSRHKDKTQIKDDRVKYWISKGAQVSDTVHNLLITKGIIKGEKINALPKKQPQVSEDDKKEETKEKEEVVEEGDVEIKKETKKDEVDDGGVVKAEPEEKKREVTKDEESEVKEEKKTDDVKKEEVKSKEESK